MRTITIGLAILASLAVTRLARAEDVTLEVRAGSGTAPTIEATITGTTASADSLTLSTADGHATRTVRASSVRRLTPDTDKLALALVIASEEIWIGNDDFEKDKNARYAGVLHDLQSAIDSAQLGSAGPAGSQAVIVSYDEKTRIVHPMGDLRTLRGAVLGMQEDYKGHIGHDLTSGIAGGLAELAKVTAERKALIVIGDGTDRERDDPAGTLEQLLQRARREGVQVFGIIWKSAVSPSESLLATVLPSTATVRTSDDIATALRAMVDRTTERFHVTFPGYDALAKRGLPWDGQPHELVISNEQAELGRATVTLAPRWSPPRPRHSSWRYALLIVASLIGLIVLARFVARRGPSVDPHRH